LDDYTYFVAGSAGELWTRLCGRHLPDYATLPQAEMLRLGKRFGQGLQLVNVLRDVRTDLEHGRCYLPADELAAAGITGPADLLRQPALVDPLLARWRSAAAERLDDAWRYVRALRGKKLRYACTLPVLLGIRTLALLAQTPPLTAAKPAKVSRGQLRNIMFTAGVGMVAPALTEAYYKRARRQATA
jgi:farnesyl-diphosphate farnesyltransferase